MYVWDRDRRLRTAEQSDGKAGHFTFSLTDAIPLGAKVGVLFWVALVLAVSLHQVMVPRATAHAGGGPL